MTLRPLIGAVFAGVVATAAQATPGAIDRSFGHGGRVARQISTAPLRLTDILVRDDGRLVVGGASACGVGCISPRAVGFDADGRFDSGFSGEAAAGIRGCAVNRFALRPAGALTVTTSDCLLDGEPTPTPAAVITGLNADGSLDTAFGEPGLGMLRLAGVRVVDAEARGGTLSLLSRRGEVIRVDQLGAASLEGSPFALPSRVGDEHSTSAHLTVLALTPLGPVTGAEATRPAPVPPPPAVGAPVTVGRPTVPPPVGPVDVLTLARLRSGGAQDHRFLLADVPREGPFGLAMVRSDGVVMLVQVAPRTPKPALLVTRVSPGGVVADGGANVALDALPPGLGTIDTTVAPDVAIGPGGRIVAAFTTTTGRIAVVRLQRNGRLDGTFPVTTPPVPRGAWMPGARVAVQPDGRILLARGRSDGRVFVTRLLGE